MDFWRSGLASIVAALALLFLPSIAGAEVQPSVQRAGVHVPLYKASFALVIGVSRYKYWTPLPNVGKEVAQVVVALQRQSFEVRTIIDPTGDALQSAFRDFVADYGRDPDHRLLIYYAGHGHSIGESGFLVPIDAPDPTADPSLFLKRAQSMTQLVSASREYRARHALYIFDSCFSGAIFNSRSNSEAAATINNMSRYLTGPASEPVRQFITAGTESQRVPEVSQFTPLLISAIEGRIPDLNRDGFVSSKELGLWLSKNLSRYTSNQTPRSGTILDSRLDRGDLVFFVGRQGSETRSQPLSEPRAQNHQGGLQSPPSTAQPTPGNMAAKPDCFTFNGRQFCE